MKQVLLTQLRDKDASIIQYREATYTLGTILAMEAAQHFPQKEVRVETPLTKTDGYCYSHGIVLIPILRAGLALLQPFMQFYRGAKVGFIGLRRDEQTAHAELYYQNLPKIHPEDYVILLDPMIATGGSGAACLDTLKEMRVKEEKILYASILAAPEGIARLKEHAPNLRIIVAQMDEALNDQKFITPGLGDFGDRFFGTEHHRGQTGY